MGPRYYHPSSSPPTPTHLTPHSKFWRHELVRLKFHNPAVSMTVDRSAPQTEPASMTIFFSDASDATSSPTSAPVPTSSTTASKAPSDYTPALRTESIEMTHRTQQNILSDLIKITGAKTVEPTPEELDTLRGLEEQRVKGARDSKLSLEHREKKKREEEILAQARGDVAASEA